jgi:hypothetical protein
MYKITKLNKPVTARDIINNIPFASLLIPGTCVKIPKCDFIGVNLKNLRNKIYKEALTRHLYHISVVVTETDLIVHRSI